MVQNSEQKLWRQVGRGLVLRLSFSVLVHESLQAEDQIVFLLYQAWVVGQTQLAPAVGGLNETCSVMHPQFQAPDLGNLNETFRLMVLLFDYPTTEVLAFGSQDNRTATEVSYLNTLCDDCKDTFHKSGDNLNKNGLVQDVDQFDDVVMTALFCYCLVVINY